LKTLLIYPEFPDTFWGLKHALRFIRKKAAYPPLGLLTVAALLPEDWQKRLVDMNVASLSEADLEWAETAFIGGMGLQRGSARSVIASCKEAGLRVIAGGPLFTSEAEAFEGVDHFVLDEAELTLPAFLSDLAAGKAQTVYRAAQYCDIRATPIPMWDLVDLRRYASMCLQFSRGCPFNCEFCNVTALFGHRPRTKTPEQVLLELDALYQRGWRGNVFFVDDNFIGNKGYVKKNLLPALIEWRRDKSGLPFHTEASVNLADDPELMDLMLDAGFDAVFVGIESPDEASLTECKKLQNNNRDLVENVRTIQRAGLQVQGGFILGFDSDTPAIFSRQIEFIQKSGIVTAMVGILVAPPGTRLWDRLKSEGRLLGPMTGDNLDGTTNIVPRMGLASLRRGYRSVMSHIYAPKNYYRRVRTFLREYRPPKARIPLEGQRILAFPRSVFRLGILGRERFQYWRLLLWTLLRRPRLLSLAVTFAIYGYHYRKFHETPNR
jgi:radical SAM superfamily enzyme YgiQ (UPF0313 family)